MSEYTIRQKAQRWIDLGIKPHEARNIAKLLDTCCSKCCKVSVDKKEIVSFSNSGMNVRTVHTKAEAKRFLDSLHASTTEADIGALDRFISRGRLFRFRPVTKYRAIAELWVREFSEKLEPTNWTKVKLPEDRIAETCTEIRDTDWSWFEDCEGLEEMIRPPQEIPDDIDTDEEQPTSAKVMADASAASAAARSIVAKVVAAAKPAPAVGKVIKIIGRSAKIEDEMAMFRALQAFSDDLLESARERFAVGSVRYNLIQRVINSREPSFHDYQDDEGETAAPSVQPSLPGLSAYVAHDYLVMIHDNETGAADPEIVKASTDEEAVRVATNNNNGSRIKLLPFSCRPWKTYLCGGGNVAVSVAKASDFGRLVYRSAKVSEMVELVGV